MNMDFGEWIPKHPVNTQVQSVHPEPLVYP